MTNVRMMINVKVIMNRLKEFDKKRMIFSTNENKQSTKTTTTRRVDPTATYSNFMFFISMILQITPLFWKDFIWNTNWMTECISIVNIICIWFICIFNESLWHMLD